MRTILAFVLAFGIAASLHAEFLVPDREYRCPPSDHACKSLHNLSSVEEHQTEKGNKFTINFVEFNDKGQPWNSIELSDALDQVRKGLGDEGKGAALVVVYIHGWQNNADDVKGSCQDVCRFRDKLLTHLADTQAEAGGRPLKVVGIYLAWRGLTFTVEPFKHIVSYWPRRGVARHVGQTGMFQALTQIEKVVGEKRQSYVLVLAGHSFGARVLENAADTRDRQHTGFMLTYRSEVTQLSAQQPMSLGLLSEQKRALNTDLPADLVFYVNAATASTVTRKTIKDFREMCSKTPNAPICRADPFYLAVSSHADLATGIIMPIANLVFPALTSDHLHLISAADTPWLHTHNDPSPGCRPAPSVCFTVTPGEPTGQESVDRIDGRTQVPGRINQPFWIFNVGKNVMKDHGDVWNDAVTDLVTHVIRHYAKPEVSTAVGSISRECALNHGTRGTVTGDKKREVSSPLQSMVSSYSGPARS